MSATATTPITIGTAGHIDHGKTLLVEQLTGMRADRPYERERGMTIDIGYAEMSAPDGRRIGFVDLPGHERFIRNMVAGATGVDLALLVVAADDGVMPQTREHLEILGLLSVRRGLVVLNKIDLVDEETRLLALEELKDFLEGTALADAPVLACSASSGEGVEAVRDTLLELVRDIGAADDPGRFYLAVQRTFAAAGFGCILTGVPASGAVAVGDELELLPAGKRGRVRAIEIYHAAAETARAGHRTAINLAGVHHEDVKRGMVVAQPASFLPSRHIAVQLKLLESARRPLRHAGRIRFLTGTLEEMGSVYLLAGDALKPGDEALVEVRTVAPVTVREADALIVRSENAKETLGGGRVVRALDRPIGRRNIALRSELERWAQSLSDPLAKLRCALEHQVGASVAELSRKCQLEQGATAKLILGLKAAGEVVDLPGGGIVRSTDLSDAVTSVRTALTDLHKAQPLVEALPTAEVRDRAEVTEAMLTAALGELGDEVVAEARTLRLESHEVHLDANLSRAAKSVHALLTKERFAPSAEKNLAEATGLPQEDVKDALVFLRDRGSVRPVAPGIFFAREVLDEGLRLLKAVAAKRGSFEPIEAKTAFGGVSRKWLIPLLEYYDRLGATRRDGNARIFTRRGEAMAEGGIDAK
jgi:selenocysteine-specific elongation factor